MAHHSHNHGHHHHGHHHSAVDGMSHTEANAHFFDKMAEKALSESWLKVERRMTSELRDRLVWIGIEWANKDVEASKDVRLLDYACGTGMMTRTFAPHITSATGVDVSPAMIKAFNTCIPDSGLPYHRVSAVVGDIISDPPSSSVTGPDFQDFDLIAIGFAYHHFEHQDVSVRKLSERLKPGGVFLITDFAGEQKGHVPEEAAATMKVTGFEEEDVKSVFAKEGLVDFGLEVLKENVVFEMDGVTIDRKVFIAKGRKPDRPVASI
ncbi:S-adenosyl-L-methionine-dependent methyltransferase [Aulographum hederae CBS 113979]|uniref:S-adenosyl-L-methionine-dependent methyltransferase n=1 Tax=Aulographum hederae CBS 113979 TaxID=1176131 RepID=A0A6G1HED3_9PEZI|nr:S-adenosyl-L-methionine-dependent methyltransferase [Aulographum hederae CBS 113979]